MNARGEWIIDPGVMDVTPLPNGLSLVFNPPQNVERSGHDSNFGSELADNQSGWEAVVDADGNLIGGSYFENVGFSEDMKALIWEDDQWFEVDHESNISAFHGKSAEPLKYRYRQRSKPPEVYDRFLGNHPECAESVKLFSQPNRQPDSLSAALNIRWGLLDKSGAVIVPAIHRYISCPQHGVALVPDSKRGLWCPVGPDEHASTLAICQAVLWDGIIYEFSRPEKLDPDPFEDQVHWKQRQLLPSQFPNVVEKPRLISR